MTLSVEPDPPGVGPSQITVTLTDQNGAPVEGATVEVVGAMAQDDMELRMAMKPAEASGNYETPFIWAASGNWTLKINATLAGRQIARRQFAVAVEEKMSIEMGGHSSGHRQQHQPELIANNGARVQLVSPPAEAVFEAGRDVPVQIATENFNLGQAGNHWHIYVDDRPGIMIMGQMNSAVLRNLEPGTHQIAARLSVGTHQELEDGAKVTITILEAADHNFTMK